MNSSIKEDLERLFPSDMRKYSSPRPNFLPVKLTERISLLLTPSQLKAIDMLVDAGKFSNRSEAIRYMIIRYLDNL